MFNLIPAVISCWSSELSALPQSLPSDECKNIVYVKVPKTGSSTSSGIARRLAAHQPGCNFSAIHENWTECQHRHCPHGGMPGHHPSEPFVLANHMEFRKLESGLQDLERKVFLWSTIRHPFDRCLSFYYYANAGKGNNTIESKLKFLREVRPPHACVNLQFNYLRPKECMTVDCVLNKYDFLATAELFEESMLLMGPGSLNTSLSSIMFIAAKVRRQDMPWSKEPPEILAEAMSTRFLEANTLDFELWLKATARIRALIKVGGEELKQRIRDYQEKIDKAADVCEVKHKHWDAYFGDQGLKYKCLDKHFGI